MCDECRDTWRNEISIIVNIETKNASVEQQNRKKKKWKNNNSCRICWRHIFTFIQNELCGFVSVHNMFNQTPFHVEPHTGTTMPIFKNRRQQKQQIKGTKNISTFRIFFFLVFIGFCFFVIQSVGIIVDITACIIKGTRYDKK